MGTFGDFANQLRERIDIVDVVGTYVKLRRAGANWKGLCPFHREKTPSFMVSQTKQIFHCFGCHTGGDVFRFVELIEHVEWKDAVRLLAEKYGVPMPAFRPAHRDEETRDNKKTLYDINNIAVQYFAQNLQAALEEPSHPASLYCSRRSLDRASIEKFRLGLAPDEWNGFLQAAQKNGYSTETVLAAGLAVSHQSSGRIYDRFRSRIIFPIFDNVGRPVAFGGRVYLEGTANDQPKYINSPETSLYKKGQYLYGFHLAKEAIAREKVAILVEGYMDVIRAHQHGFPNTVASCGTALTTDQALALRRLCDKIVFVYDGDEAGQKAMLRGCEILLSHEFFISVVVLPDDHDPDSFLLKYGREAFARHIESALDFYEFFLQTALKRYGNQTVAAKAQAVDFLLPILQKVTNEITLHEYLARTAQALRVEEVALRKYVSRKQDAGKILSQQPIRTRLPQIPKLERYLLKLCVEREDLQYEILSRIRAEWLSNSIVQKWFSLCQERLLEGQRLDWASLISLCEDGEGEDACFLRALALDDSEPVDRIDPCVIENVAARLEREYIVRHAKNLKDLCRSLDEEGAQDEEKWKQTQAELTNYFARYKDVLKGLQPRPELWKEMGDGT